MKLMTKAIEKRIPGLHAQNGDDAIVHVKFFNPTGYGTWFATEFDPEQRVFFGWVELHPGCGEFGYFSLDELASVRLRFGLRIERDSHFKPVPLSEALGHFHRSTG